MNRVQTSFAQLKPSRGLILPMNAVDDLVRLADPEPRPNWARISEPASNVSLWTREWASNCFPFGDRDDNSSGLSNGLKER
jgi:hypothetical protein